MALYIGADIGTSGVKAVAIDEKGKVRASAASPCALSQPRQGWAEQDPERWMSALGKAVSRLTASLGLGKREVAGLGLSGQMHGLVALDRTNRPIRPAILWCDTRTTEQCRQIEKRAGKNLARWVANPALEGFTAPKILWLREKEPAAFRRMKKFLTPKDYVRFRLTGEMWMEMSDASGTLLLDVKKRTWSREMREALELPASLYSGLKESTDLCGTLTAEAARALGLPEGLPVAGGGADNACGAVGAGVVRPGVATSSIGSSGVVFACADKPKVDPGLRAHTFNHSDPKLWYLMGCMLSAGLSFRWFRDVLCEKEMRMEAQGKGDAYDRIVKLARKAPPGSGGLFFMPYLYGERTPHKDALARGGFVGLTSRHDRSCLARAVMEGVVFGLRDATLVIEELGQDIQEYRALGGGGKSAFWRRMQADVYGKPVAALAADEGPAFGAALLAAVATGGFRSVREAAERTVKVRSVVMPDPGRHDFYGKRHALFQELYPRLKQAFHRTAELESAGDFG